jgi:gliding motility-associated-like protein
VADRFGEIVYKGDGKNTGWDGKFKKENVALGTYYYVFSIKFIDGKTKVYKGDILLIR